MTLAPGDRPFLVLISGATGTGKSVVAAALAERIGGEIINADSVQIYRGFDIGSAKPDPTLLRSVPHHLYDRLEPEEHLDAARWTEMAEELIEAIDRRHNTPIIVGGTNFYLRALVRGLPRMPARQPQLRLRLEEIFERPSGARHLHRLLRAIDPASGARIDRADHHRVGRAIEVLAASGRPLSSFDPPSPADPPRYPYAQFALSLDRSELRRKLDFRVRTMYEAGLIEEVRNLLAAHSSDLRPFASIGYKEAVDYIRGELDRSAAIETTMRRTRAYARRQMTWLRAERDVQWLDASVPVDRIVQLIVDALLEKDLTGQRKISSTDI